MHKPRRTGLMRMTRYLNHLYWGCGWNHLGPYSLHGYYHCPLPKGGGKNNSRAGFGSSRPKERRECKGKTAT